MKIHLGDGEKGGVGKSWFMYCMSEYLRAKSRKFYLYAADRSNPTAVNKYRDKERYAKFYDDAIQYVVFSENERKMDGPDGLLDMALERDIIIDLPAQAHIPLSNWINCKDVFSLSKDNDIEWVRWYVCDGKKDSIDLLESTANFFKDQQTYVVRNWRLCDNWDLFADRLTPVIKKYNMTVIDFPKLSETKASKMDTNNWTFEEAVEFGNFKIIGNAEIHRYVRSVYEMFDSTNLLN